MRIAILGAGFAGLGAAWHLVKIPEAKICVFDAIGIGGGASGIAAGLMHPYVGEEGKRSYLATEGLSASNELFAAIESKSGKTIAERKGILRYMLHEEQKKRFVEHSQRYGDVHPYGNNCFWISSGVTVDCALYLKELGRVLSDLGVEFVLEKVLCLSALNAFDHIVFAAGSSIDQFPETKGLKISVLKGQVISGALPESADLPLKSSIQKGYIALSPSSSRICHIGATYERNFSDCFPDLAFAKQELLPKISSFFPGVEALKEIECKAGLRVINKGHYFPIITKISQKGNPHLWAFTALGSRGLLYHALGGERLAKVIAETISPGFVA